MNAEDSDSQDFCPFCQIHVQDGMRKHKFSKKHQKKLKEKLSRFLKKVSTRYYAKVLADKLPSIVFLSIFFIMGTDR